MGDLFILQVLAFSQETILKFSVFKEHPIFPIRVEYFQNPGSIFLVPPLNWAHCILL
jgi:hypothetical protein